MASFVAGSSSLLLALLVVGLLLAMLGQHRWYLHLPLAVSLALRLRRLLPRGLYSPVRGSAAAGVVVLAASIVVMLASTLLHTELVIAGRDGATYANTAVFLIEGTDLFPAAIEQPFAGIDGLEFQSPGFVPRTDGRFWQQFLHATSALFATVGELGGTAAMYWVNPVIGAVSVSAMYALARRFTSPWWAVLGSLILSVTLPFVYFTRATFSEAASLTLGIAGIWVATHAFDTESRFAFGAGLLLGGTALVRVDGWTSGLALALLVVWTHLESNGHHHQVAERLWRGFLIVGLLGILDIVGFSFPYVFILGVQFQALVATTVAVRLAVPLVSRVAAVWPGRGMSRSTSQAVAAVGVVGLLLFAWLVRPRTGVARAEFPYALEEIQRREALPIDPTRTYAEFSMEWLSWYIGVPILLLGCLGVAVAVFRALGKDASWSLRTACLSFLVPAAIYIYRPSINPDHIWAMRRFLPVVIPGFLIAAMVAASWLTRRFRNGFGRIIPLFVAIGLALGPVATAWPLWFESEGAGTEAWMQSVCAEIDGAPVLIVDDDPEVPLSWRLGPPLRAWCGVSVAGVTPDRVDWVARQLVEADGVVVIRVADMPPLIEARALPVLSTRYWQSTLMRPPDRTTEATLELDLADLATNSAEN